MYIFSFLVKKSDISWRTHIGNIDGEPKSRFKPSGKGGELDVNGGIVQTVAKNKKLTMSFGWHGGWLLLPVIPDNARSGTF